MTYDVLFSPEALTDLLDIYNYIAPSGGEVRALAYLERIHATCVSLQMLPGRGHRRDDIRPGLRVIGFERRVAIAFHIQETLVVIDRLLYGGRDLQRTFPGA